MKLKVSVIAALIFSLVVSTASIDSAFAVSTTGHATPGGSGIKPAVNPNFPSVVYRVGASYQKGLAVRDADGNTQKGTEPFKGYGIVLTHKIMWTPDIEEISWLGNARYHTHLIVPTAFTESSVANGPYNNSLGFGDPSFFPLDLSWHFDRVQLMYYLGGFLPIGDYDKGNPTSLGRGFWSLVNIAGITWWIDEKKDWCLSVLARYEKHYTKKDTDFRNGDDLSFEWSLSKNITKEWEIGLVGYDWMQVTDDKGRDELGRSADLYDRDEVHALGLEAQYTNFEQGWQIALRGMRDYKTESRNEAWNTTLTFTYLF